MGKIADAIEEVEQEVEELREALKVANLRLDELEEIVEGQKQIIDEYQATIDYVEENHPEIITACEVATRMEK